MLTIGKHKDNITGNKFHFYKINKNNYSYK